jgi:hypothetical protein
MGKVELAAPGIGGIGAGSKCLVYLVSCIFQLEACANYNFYHTSRSLPGKSHLIVFV